ncbi:hypothetical protein RB195_005013 [Necator americanus]|uniref:Chromo domain-containing protein n=1 Tax=Necator americanus TaxID=51031 RepID=A0ABR1BNT3_NECAM
MPSTFNLFLRGSSTLKLSLSTFSKAGVSIPIHCLDLHFSFSMAATEQVNVKMECEEPSAITVEEKPPVIQADKQPDVIGVPDVAIEPGMEGHVHPGDAGLEDEDDEMEDEGNESEGDEVESIVDIKIQNGIFKYRVRWVGCKPSEDTWEPEESFTGSESKALLEEYRETHKDRVEELLRNEKNKKGRRSKRGPRWEYVSEIVTREDKTALKPRELQSDDVFYGQTAAEVAAASGELKKLFDPTHKNTVTELFLSTTDPAVKVTRSQTKALIGSREESRSNTPISSKLLTAEDTCRGSASPTPNQAPKSRQKKGKASGKRTTKRRAAKEQEEEPSTEAVVVTSASLVDSQTNSTSPSDKPPIVLKLTLKKADKPAKREKRSSSEKSPKEKKKKEKKTSLPTVVTSPSPKLEPSEPDCSNQQTKIEATDASVMFKTEIKPKLVESASKPQTVTSASPAAASSDELPAPKGRRRALHLLPGPISINEPLTSQVLNGMLRDLEIKYYGEEERHPYSQEQFNEAILSGNFMRVRRAMVNNLLTAPRLAMWTNTFGANLLHLLCRTLKCDERHAGDDIATVLCNIAPTLLAGRDNHNRLPIHDAVDKGQVCRVFRLLTFHSPVNVIDRNGNTPLSLAYAKNHAKMMRILLQGGANFWTLESSERRKPENLRKRRAFDVLSKHSRIMSAQLVRARRKVYRLLTEVRTTSPCFTAPFADGPEFSFIYYHYPLPQADVGQCGHILFLHVCSVKPEGGALQARCWGGLRLAQAPQHNNRPLEPTSFTERGDHMMFFITPVNGANTIHVRISDAEMPKKLILAMQVVLVRRAVRENSSSSHSHYPPLEQAPMATERRLQADRVRLRTAAEMKAMDRVGSEVELPRSIVLDGFGYQRAIFEFFLEMR